MLHYDSRVSAVNEPGQRRVETRSKILTKEVGHTDFVIADLWHLTDNLLVNQMATWTSRVVR